MSDPYQAIRIKNLVKKFGSRTAVDNISFDIKRGEIFSLLGTNGAGKTTTIKMLSSLIKPTSGEATVMNININDNPLAIKKIIGVSPQETAIAGHLNSKENLLLMGGVYGLKTSVSKERAMNLMNLLEIDDRKDRASKLSGGLQRRLSIAMALMSDPQILFLDEPTLGLDPHARKSVWKYIEKLKNDKTILLTTHYLEEADFLSDTIAIMQKGKIIEIGTSQELKQRFTRNKILQISAVNLNTQVNDRFNSMGIKSSVTSDMLVLEAPNFDFYEVIDVLKQMHIDIKGITMAEPTLDDVFLKLTEKEERA